MVQKGMVLFITIVILAILNILILSLTQAVFLYIKASSQLEKRHQMFYQLEEAAYQLAKLNLKDFQSQCMPQVKTPNELIEKLQNFQGCKWVHDKVTYLYSIEDLGIFPCLQTNSGDLLSSTHHWFLSVSTTEEPIEIVQLRIANSVELVQCEGETRKINSGVVSWRHLFA